MAIEKVLGMWWCTSSDAFTYKVGRSRNDRALWQGQPYPTKREVLRVLGLIANFLMVLKILLQEVWRSGNQWDDPISESSFEKWKRWLQVLLRVEQVTVPRCYRIRTSSSANYEVQLHTFVDGSENGFATAVYLRFVQKGIVECVLVSAKTRVAPLKFTSIPRLELQAAVFVAFRVSEILEITEINEWRLVPTKLNVADDATKWTGQPDMTANSRWFKEPDFLWRPEAEWPQPPTKSGSSTAELHPNLLIHYTASSKRCVNIVVHVYPFPANCKLQLQGKSIVTGHQQQKKLKKAESYLHRHAQLEAYQGEMTLLQQRTYQLTPVLDQRGVIVMKGRTRFCDFVTEDAKNPIILPRDHHLTTLIIAYYHQKYHHQNHEATINETRQKYKISRLRVCYAKVRRRSQQCKNDSSVPRPPIMADLPPARLAAFSRPFTHVGIDYFGPIGYVNGKRVEKRWAILATCLTIRAQGRRKALNLAAICPTKKPTDEVLQSLLTEIKNVVNSRPLTRVPVDDESDPALTPNHFLLGSSNGTKPLTVNDDSGIVLHQGWRVSQTLVNQFWRRWLTNYLPEITRRTKWFIHTKPVCAGDVVVIVDPKLPRNCWPKGKIIETCNTRDGQIRSATVRTVNGMY
ncbi:uncharacterized protein LOC131679644 [Topomyia yanbarensis]|uniref:uncharacterized protein LOC131679644 n=1 Tax=Topomyia yanbarensis TaxID=2498891 RepID=UPI00273C72D1|nr:uncharacterized protein LOC131679644 [Topomyia yanbarensis]